MNKLELMMKVIDKSQEPKDSEEAKLKRIIEGADEDDTLAFTYNPYVLDMRDVMVFGKDDAEHTKIMTPAGLLYAKIDYPTFSGIYETMTGNMIKRVSDFKMMRR